MQRLFWLGRGVIEIDGKDYGNGKEIPAENIQKEKLKKLMDDGKIGALPERVEVIDNAKVEVNKLKTELAEIEEAFNKLDASHIECVDANNALKDTNDALTDEVVKLKEQNDFLTKDNNAIKESHVQLINENKELKKKVKK